jgi:hypothetical protein
MDLKGRRREPWPEFAEPDHPDPAALDTVLMSAVSHYRVLSDGFGGVHPHGVDEERFLASLVRLAVPG